jgi:hypothetical protein
MHPGVVLGLPHPQTGKFPVAMISKKLPGDPPQKPIEHFYHDSHLLGNIRLAPPKMVKRARPWRNENTGANSSPMSHEGMQRLQEEMGEQFTSRSRISCLFINTCRTSQRLAFPVRVTSSGWDS